MNRSAHPSPELLASFVDGRLPDEERRAMVAHLDVCPDCYEVFAGTVRFQGEEEPRGQVLRPPRLAAKRWLGWAAAAAAVVAVAIVVPVLRMEPGQPLLSSEALVAAIEVPEGVEVAGAVWSGWPGGELGFAEGAPPGDEAVAFRTGVRLVDLRAAVKAREPGGASAVLDGLGGVLRAAGLAEELEEPIREAREAADERRFEALELAATEIEAAAEVHLYPFHLAFGKWAEAGRLAAAVGDRGFFRSPEFVGFREAIGAREPAEDPALAEIDTLMQGDMGPPEAMVDLEKAFRRLIGRAGGTT
ncbi:MAG TPA: zf-HC2 domain-containing protein [Thermoanaerobaculia bacterium]|nr:zf-HC2 domain-containing protein [Thermoanaerobaculia bacterium]